MSREVTEAFQEAVNAAQTSEVFLVLLTIDHEQISEPIRVVCNNEDIESNGELFVGYPFEINLPTDMEDGSPKATLTIDNVDQMIVRTLRGVQTKGTVRIQIVLASNPDVIEADFPDFQMSDVQYDALTVTANLSLEQFIGEPFPGDTFTPAMFPGMF